MIMPGIITCRQINNRFSCDNCNREMPLGIVYEFYDNGKPRPYVTLTLCEDCSNSLGNLHCCVMLNETPHMYCEDEIIEVKQ